MAREYKIKRPQASKPKFRIDYAAELNEQQLAAVTAKPDCGPMLVIAGAGSGKTRTLTFRVAYLLEAGVSGRNILLLTFTNKASKEMLERVGKLAPGAASEVWGGTFHSVGLRILRKHAKKLGFTEKLSILDSEDRKSLISSLLDDVVKDPAMRKELPKPGVIGEIFSLAVNKKVELREILDSQFSDFSMYDRELTEIRKKYEEQKKRQSVVDFDDLLEKPLVLFKKHPDVAAIYQEMFQHVLVDEYQDTNPVQAEFIALLAQKHNNVMAVGDDAQSIYSWRGADFRNILDFEGRYPDATEHRIETNYRSTPQVLSLANESISKNVHQKKKSLKPARPDGNLPALVTVNDPSAQAQFVAQRIEELVEEGSDLNEMAVLYRAHFQSMEVQMELTRRNIPFQITSGLRFFEQAHVKDVAAFMRIAYNFRDEVAFKRIVLMMPGIGKVSASKLWHTWYEAFDGSLQGPGNAPYSDTLKRFKVPQKAEQEWAQFSYVMDEFQTGEGELVSPAEMIHSVMEGIYNDYGKKTFADFSSRKQDLEYLTNYATRYEDLEEFLGQLSLMSNVDTDARNAERNEPKVTLSTAHQAKGLEWDAVFTVWMAEGMFPNRRVIDEDFSGEGLEEERRLFYVAMTRAKDELYLIFPETWPRGYSGDFMQSKSRFIKELPQELMEEWKIGYTY